MKTLQLKTFNEHYRYFQNLLRDNNMSQVGPGEAAKRGLPDISQYETLLKITPGIIFLVDYSQHSYLYHSPAITQLDMDLKLMYEHGTTYTFSLFQEDHYQIMRKHIFPHVYRLFGEYIHKGEGHKIRFSYCNKMRTPSKEYRWFMHHLSVLTSHENEPVIGLKYMIDIHDFKKDNAMDFVATLSHEDGSFQTLLKESFHPTELLLTDRELELIPLLAQGKTSRQIADELGISPHTVNSHRKNMLLKTNAANITELVTRVSGR